MLYQTLLNLPPERTMRVALVGAGAMGVGIAYQVGITPGMILTHIADIAPEAQKKGIEAYNAGLRGCPIDKVGGDKTPTLCTDILPALKTDDPGFDVLVEATNTIAYAAEACFGALERGIHVVLMNAEVDLLLGPLLHQVGAENGALVTSDGGDQHGVLMKMIDEIRLWGFRIVMAGNIKGFLDEAATVESIREEARIRNLNPVQCVAYTDGTKLNIEMAVIANALGLVPTKPGMVGPRAKDVREVFNLFNFDELDPRGVIDYILGAEPGGGVYVIGHCADPIQMPYLKYYKLGNGPYYLFYRPYHLCHLETPQAIAELCLRGDKVLEPTFGKFTEVVTVAKRDLEPGLKIKHAIGSDEFLGVVDLMETIEAQDGVPITLMDFPADQPAELIKPLAKGERLTFGHLKLPECSIVSHYRRQESLLAVPAGSS